MQSRGPLATYVTLHKLIMFVCMHMFALCKTELVCVRLMTHDTHACHSFSQAADVDALFTDGILAASNSLNHNAPEQTNKQEPMQEPKLRQ